MREDIHVIRQWKGGADEGDQPMQYVLSQDAAGGNTNIGMAGGTISLAYTIFFPNWEWRARRTFGQIDRK